MSKVSVEGFRVLGFRVHDLGVRDVQGEVVGVQVFRV